MGSRMDAQLVYEVFTRKSRPYVAIVNVQKLNSTDIDIVLIL